MKKKLPAQVNKKQQEREALLSYEKLVEKWSKVPKFSRVNSPPTSNKLELKLVAPPGRETQKIQSMVTPGSSTARKQVLPYTGDKMIGIGQMHKSNSVPIFNHEAAIDVAKMRRN